MLSVAQSADLLNVSSTRIRALIKAGFLPAKKNGREWVLREEDVMQRMFSGVHSGRPKKNSSIQSNEQQQSIANMEARNAYDLCRKLFQSCPSSSMIAQARSHEEASFYMAVGDFFLQQKQRELVKQGVF